MKSQVCSKIPWVPLYHYRFCHSNDLVSRYFSASLFVDPLLRNGMKLCVLHVLLVTLSFVLSIIVEYHWEEKNRALQIQMFRSQKKDMRNSCSLFPFPAQTKIPVIKLQEKWFKVIITIHSKNETVPLPPLPTEKCQYDVEKEDLSPPYTHHHTCITIHAPQYIYQHTCTTIHVPPCMHPICAPLYVYHHTCIAICTPPYVHHHTCITIHAPPCLYHQTCTFNMKEFKH